MTSHPSKEKQLDQTVEESFPASDPPSSTGITGPGKGGGPGKSGAGRSAEQEPIPTGHPTSDRYASETAHHKEEHATTTESPEKPQQRRG
jgi:hypothetical protein